MKFIAPLEIASKIMTLIVEAEKELILVSPYVKINDWDKMKKSLSKAVSKRVAITFIARQNTTCDFEPLKALNIKPILVQDLHAKVYINDKYAIVTSQNITHYSDINSIDIAYQTEDEKERLELINFVKNYVIDSKSTNTNIQRAVQISSSRPKEIFQKVESHNYDNKKQFNDFEVEKLHQAFLNNFPESNIKRTATYLFCGDLLPFADVMIDSRYVIKIKKSRPDCELIVKKIESINFSYQHTFKIQLLTSHKSFYYIDFIPLGVLKLDRLIKDYFNITNSILDNGYL